MSARKIVGWNLVYTRRTHDPRGMTGAGLRPVPKGCKHPRNRRSPLDSRLCLDCGEVLR